VAIAGSTATYTLQNGPDLEVSHHGTHVLLAAGQPTTVEIPPPPPDPHPSQPPGREPARRSVQLLRRPEEHEGA
jgi:alpha,alpha-trehalose phosphorylase